MHPQCDGIVSNIDKDTLSQQAGHHHLSTDCNKQCEKMVDATCYQPTRFMGYYPS